MENLISIQGEFSREDLIRLKKEIPRLRVPMPRKKPSVKAIAP